MTDRSYCEVDDSLVLKSKNNSEGCSESRYSLCRDLSVIRHGMGVQQQFGGCTGHGKRKDPGMSVHAGGGHSMPSAGENLYTIGRQ